MHDSNPEATPAPPRWKPLDERQRRVLGVLVEKAKTTPAGYPMPVNAIVAGCNQKSHRDPVMDLDDFAVEKTLDELRALGAVSELVRPGRVRKFEHQAHEWLGVNELELAVLTELLLRGPQTLGDLRVRASRMEPIGDLASLRPIVAGLLERGLMIALTPPGRGQVVTHSLYPPGELADLRTVLPGSRAAPASAAERDPSPPGAVHVRWDDLPREPLAPSLERRFVSGRHMTLAQFFLARGAVVPAHEHENEQFANVLEGCLRFRLGPEGAEVVEVRSGEVLMLPPWLRHSVEALEDSVIADVFSPVRNDWLGTRSDDVRPQKR